MRVTERKEAVALVKRMRELDLRFCHVPNEGNRSFAAAQAMRSQGLRPGVPDYLIFNQPDPPFAHYHGVALELKRSKGSVKSSIHQRDWIEGLRQLGWIAEVVTAEQGIELINWLYDDPIPF